MRRHFIRGLTILLLAGTAFQIQAADYPAVFAAEGTIYPGAKVLQNYQDSDGQHTDLLVSGDPSDVVDYYVKQLKARGWTLKNFQEAGPVAAADLRHDGKQMIVMVIEERGKVTATLTLTTP